MARILLVEDDAHVRPPMEMLLSLEPDYEVSAVPTVAKAIALLGLRSFDLVITDLDLPDGNGLEIAETARAAGSGVLVVTGNAVMLQPGSLDGYEYLLKPMRGETLLAKVRQLLPRDNPVLPFRRARSNGRGG